MDYYAQSVGIRAFGLTERGVRIHAALFGALGAAALAALLLGSRLHPCAITTALAFCISHPLLVRYSQEARPVALAVLCSVLYLATLFQYLLAPRPRTRGMAALRLALLVFVQLFFLLSVGFQPVIFLVTSSAALAPLLLCRTLRPRVLGSYLSQALAFLLAWPVLKNVAHESKRYLACSPYVRQLDPLELLGRMLAAFQEAIAQGPALYYRPILGPAWMVVLAAPVLCLPFLSKLAPTREHESADSDSRQPWLYLCVFTTLFPMLFQTVFRTVVQWDISVRYYLTFAPVLILFHAFTLDALLRGVALVIRRPAAKRVLSACICLFAALPVLPWSVVALTRMYAEPKTDWRALYAMFRNTSEQPCNAYILTFANPSRWVSSFVAQDFYYADPQARPVQLRGNHKALAADYAKPEFAKLREIVLVFLQGADRIEPAWFEDKQGIRVATPHDMRVATVTGGPEGRERLKALLSDLLERLPPSAENHELLRLLCRMDISDGRSDSARRRLAQLRAVNADGSLDAAIADLEAACLKLQAPVSKTLSP